MGLGLSLCRTVIEEHGGALTFENHFEDGAVAGASFHFTLPALSDEALGNRRRRTRDRDGADFEQCAPERALGRPVIYLVDDEAPVREALALLLRSRRLLSEIFDCAEAFEAMLEQRGLSSPRALAHLSVLPGPRHADAGGQRRAAIRSPSRERSRQRASGHLPDRSCRRPKCGRSRQARRLRLRRKAVSNNGLVDRIEEASGRERRRRPRTRGPRGPRAPATRP